MEIAPKDIPIIRTKFYLPQETSLHVQRHRLLQQMQCTLVVPLMLVSAPAGYGKSVLVGDWCRSQNVPVAWLSLDSAESDLMRFLIYFSAAVDNSIEDALADSRGLLLSSEEPTLDELASAFINDFDCLDDTLLVVLDDYHAIEHSSPVHEFIARILQHPPGNVHIILVTRRDPPLPLARLRARNQLAEVRSLDLQFLEDETAEWMAAQFAQPLSQPVVQRLNRLLEGWAAGLRMLILAAGNTGISETFLHSLEGGSRQIQEYLLQEVIGGLSPETRDLLLRSAITERFCAELIESLYAEDAGIERVEQARDFVTYAYKNNLFTSSVDATGTWFRYHHLFRELLLIQLRRNFSSSEIDDLHMRASAWFSRHGYVSDAIREALCAGYEEEAVALLEKHSIEEFNEDRWFVVRNWLSLLPPRLLQQSPSTILAQAWVANFSFDGERVAAMTQYLEQFETAQVLSAAQLGELNFFRGFISFWEGAFEAGRAYLEAAVDGEDRGGVIGGECQAYLSMLRYLCGDRDLALSGLHQAAASLAARSNAYATRAIAGQCFIHYMGMEAADTLRAAKRLSFIAKAGQNAYAAAWGAYMQGLVLLNCLQLQQAAIVFRQVVERESHIERRLLLDAMLGECLSYQLGGDVDRATQLREELVVLLDRFDDPEHIEYATSALARIALLRGETALAAELVLPLAGRAISPNMLFWLIEPQITVARVSIAHDERQDIAACLGRLDTYSTILEAQHLDCHLVDLLLLRAMANQRLGTSKLAHALLKQAVQKSSARNWQRPFIEIGAPLLEMMSARDFDGVERKFVEAVTATIAANQKPEQLAVDTSASVSPASSVLAPEIFTNREQDILELLAQRYRNKEIAEQLFISTHTVNYHLKHIYQKLGVSGRREAVAKARQSGVLGSTE